jgi:hypothetical protein
VGYSSGANAGLPSTACHRPHIRKVYDLGWKPTYFLASVATSVGAVTRPAGPEKGVGIISAAYVNWLACQLPTAEISSPNVTQLLP